MNNLSDPLAGQGPGLPSLQAQIAPVRAAALNPAAIDFITMLAIQAGMTAILASIKNADSPQAQYLKSSLLHLADAIYAAFPNR